MQVHTLQISRSVCNSTRYRQRPCYHRVRAKQKKNSPHLTFICVLCSKSHDQYATPLATDNSQPIVSCVQKLTKKQLAATEKQTTTDALRTQVLSLCASVRADVKAFQKSRASSSSAAAASSSMYECGDALKASFPAAMTALAQSARACVEALNKYEVAVKTASKRQSYNLEGRMSDVFAEVASAFSPVLYTVEHIKAAAAAGAAPLLVEAPPAAAALPMSPSSKASQQADPYAFHKATEAAAAAAAAAAAPPALETGNMAAAAAKVPLPGGPAASTTTTTTASTSSAAAAAAPAKRKRRPSSGASAAAAAAGGASTKRSRKSSSAAAATAAAAAATTTATTATTEPGEPPCSTTFAPLPFEMPDDPEEMYADAYFEDPKRE
jgi:hypothetical protein